MGLTCDAGLDVEVKSELVDDLILSYRAMIDLGRSVKPDMTRFYRLETKVNGFWPRMSNLEQKAAVKALVESGHMSSDCAAMLTMFDGRVDMSEPPEPCIKLPGGGK